MTGVEAAGKQQKGAFSSGYQGYLDSLGENERPMSYTAWSMREEGKTTPVSPACQSDPTRSPTQIYES